MTAGWLKVIFLWVYGPEETTRAVVDAPKTMPIQVAPRELHEFINKSHEVEKGKEWGERGSVADDRLWIDLTNVTDIHECILK